MRPDHAGYLGPDLGVGMHATPLAVLGLGVTAPFRLELPGNREIVTRSSFAPARAPHRIMSDGWIGLILAEPGTAAAITLRDSMTRTDGPYGLDSRHEPALIAAATAGVPDLDRLLTELTPAPRPIDPRITHVISQIRTTPAAHLRAEKIAADLGMSESHFLHTFAASTGTTFRRYRQWSRLRIVGAALQSGHDLTRCAADADFASPSHLSETSAEPSACR